MKALRKRMMSIMTPSLLTSCRALIIISVANPVAEAAAICKFPRIEAEKKRRNKDRWQL